MKVPHAEPPQNFTSDRGQSERHFPHEWLTSANSYSTLKDRKFSIYLFPKTFWQYSWKLIMLHISNACSKSFHYRYKNLCTLIFICIVITIVFLAKNENNFFLKKAPIKYIIICPQIGISHRHKIKRMRNVNI